jgi:molybdenum cofactor biosynthesis enzyme MoaA
MSLAADINPVSHLPRYQPDDHPFQTVMIDITHRCNMACRNCYIPNREIPDMDIDWMENILARFPRRTRIRIVGAEPTMRKDLPDVISRVRKLGHLPILMTNGLKIADLGYLKTLKQAGLRSVYLSFNGGFEDQLYHAIDSLACADQKISALENLVLENMYISLGMIIVRHVNEQQLKQVFEYVKNLKQVYELHARSVGSIGRYMNTVPLTLEELIQLLAAIAPISASEIMRHHANQNYIDFLVGKLKVQLTQWPDLGSKRRGRLAPDGTIQPFFEHVMANEGGY